jgi:hypothetical protein
MTNQQYRDRLRALGLTPQRPSYDGGTLYRDRDGQFVTAPDPEQLTADERDSMFQLICDVHGYSLPN